MREFNELVMHDMGTGSICVHAVPGRAVAALCDEMDCMIIKYDLVLDTSGLVTKNRFGKTGIQTADYSVVRDALHVYVEHGDYGEFVVLVDRWYRL